MSVLSWSVRPIRVRSARYRTSFSSPSRLLACAVLAVAALVGGCASTPSVRSEVTRFHDWQSAQPLTFAIRSTPPQSGSLEHRSYEQLVRDRLLTLGFSEAPAEAARYQVAFSYGAQADARRIVEYWGAPVWGGWGYSPWVGPRPYFPYWRYDPWWGVPPAPYVRDTMVFRHELRVDLFDVRIEPPPGRKVYESRAVAFADTESMPRLMPALVAAAFDDFPGQSGKTRTVDVPLADPEAAPRP